MRLKKINKNFNLLIINNLLMKNRKVESEDIFQVYLLEFTINNLFHFIYFKAV